MEYRNNISTQPDLSGIKNLARDFLASQNPDLATLRKANTTQGSALRAYEAQSSVGPRAFAKIKTGDWLAVRRKDGPNTLVFVTHVGGMKRWPAVYVAPCQQERSTYTPAQQIWEESVVAIHEHHPERAQGAPYTLLSTLAKGFATATCSAQRDANAGPYFELALGNARQLTWPTVEAIVRAVLHNAGFSTVVRNHHPKTGVPQWFATGKEHFARVRLCGTATTASIEVDFARRDKPAFRRK